MRVSLAHILLARATNPDLTPKRGGEINQTPHLEEKTEESHATASLCKWQYMS